MSAGAAALIGAARNGRSFGSGFSFSNPHQQRVWGEAVVSGIAGDDSQVFNESFRVAAAHVMSPPIRSPLHRQGLRAALAAGGLSVLATDHATFNASQKKALGRRDFRLIPNGVNGIEERLVVAFDALVAGGGDDSMGSTIPRGLATLPRLVELVSAAPAKLFGIYPQKGRVAAGSDADLVVFDPNGSTEIGVEKGRGKGKEEEEEKEIQKEEEEEEEKESSGRLRHRRLRRGRGRKHHSRVDTNIYEGRVVRGRVAATIFAGRVVWDGEVLTARRGEGRRLMLPTFVDAVFGGLEREREREEEGKKTGREGDDDGEEEATRDLFLRRWEREFPYGKLPVERRDEAERASEEL